MEGGKEGGRKESRKEGRKEGQPKMSNYLYFQLGQKNICSRKYQTVDY